MIKMNLYCNIFILDSLSLIVQYAKSSLNVYTDYVKLYRDPLGSNKSINTSRKEIIAYITGSLQPLQLELLYLQLIF